MVFTTEGFFEIATESWLEWGLIPRPLNSVQTRYLSLYIHIYLKQTSIKTSVATDEDDSRNET